MNKMNTFKRIWTYGRYTKKYASDIVCGYKCSNGRYIRVDYSIYNKQKHYIIDDNHMCFNTLKEAKEYIINNAE